MHVAGLAIDGYKKTHDERVKIFRNELRKTSHDIVGNIQTQIVDAKNAFPTSDMGKKILSQISDVYNANSRIFERPGSVKYHSIKLLTDDRLGFIEKKGT